MEEAKRQLWGELARIWGARTVLRTELFSGRDVLRRQRTKGNYQLTVCHELTEGGDQFKTWIGVESTSDGPIVEGALDAWKGLGEYNYVLSVGSDGVVEIGDIAILRGMPTNLYLAWQLTDQLFEGQLTEQLKAISPSLSNKLKSKTKVT